ncbi:MULTISPECIES: FAD-linked oxidase C-terminal domain-containing protein [Enterobacteriaceae]
MERYADPTRLTLVGAIKRALDPEGRLNAGAML